MNKTEIDIITKSTNISDKTEAIPLFKRGDSSNSPWFRIPFIHRCKSGNVIAGCDANFGSTGDSADNIEVCIRIKEGNTWGDAFIPDDLHFYDFVDEIGYRPESASFIDGAILEDSIVNPNTMWLLVDGFSWNGGLIVRNNKEIVYGIPSVARQTFREGCYDSGFEGERWLLFDTNSTERDDELLNNVRNNNFDRTNYTHYIDMSDPNYPIYKRDGERTAYRLNDGLELMYENEVLKCRAKTQDENGIREIDTEIAMNIFYKSSIFQVINTSYLMLYKSCDGGKSWKFHSNLNSQVRTSQMPYLLVCPGTGLQLKKGRMIFCVYHNGQRCRYIYSDDGGNVWKLSEEIFPNRFSSETQMVELIDGTLVAVARTKEHGGYLVAISSDNGESFKEIEPILDSEGVNCMCSAVALTKPINGKPAIIVSAPLYKNRTAGALILGLLDGDFIRWSEPYMIQEPEKQFAYSCLCELDENTLALLYESGNPDEHWDFGLQAMWYKEFNIV